MRRSFPILLGIADKSPLVVAGLRHIFAEAGGFEIVVTASDGERFLDAVRRFSFEVGIIGWEMPYLGGREVLQALARFESAPRIVVFTGTADPRAPQEAMRLGAAGFVGKQEPPERLVEAVRAAAEGRMTFPFVRFSEVGEDPLATLTERERQLLAALGSGRTNAQLARQLGVSVNTVKFHLRNLFDKIGARNRAQAVEIYLRYGR
ncbi:Response regulator UvrY [bacterium HR40]|nr:Response regulator UvrY [bacterium HR40]